MDLHIGVHLELEGEADRLIRESLQGVTSMSAKSDILTKWKQQDRLGREVYNISGVADASARKGIYHRAWNPRQTHLNSRDGHLPPERDQDSKPYDLGTAPPPAVASLFDG